MLEADRLALSKMMREFEELANVSESEFKCRGTPELKMMHYKIVYDVMLRGTKGARDILFMHFQSMLTNYLLRYETDLSSCTDEEQFSSVCKIWLHYKMLMDWNLSAFRYFSRFYRTNLEEAGVTIFMERIWRKCELALYRVALKTLHQERVGQAVDRMTLVTVLGIASTSQYCDLNYSFESEFVVPYISQMVADLKDMLTQVDKGCPSADALFARLQKALEEEERLSMTYFPPNRRDQIMNAARETVRTSPVAEQRLLLAEDGLLLHFERRHVDVLQQYFEVFSSEGESLFPNVFQQVIENCGSKLEASSGGKPRHYAKAVIDLHNLCALVVEQCFGKSQQMSAAVRRGLEHVFEKKISPLKHDASNSQAFGFWDAFVAHIDYNMRHQQRDGMDTKSLSVICCLHDDTEVLNLLAESMLQRMLLPDGAFHLDEEKKFVELFASCVGKKVPQLESIINDLEVSNSFMEVFTQQQSAPSGFDFLALRRSNWVVRRVEGPELTLPSEIACKLESIREEYLCGTHYRTFKWCHHASSAVVEAFFDGYNRSTTLHLSASQAIVLLSLNDREKISIAQLCEEYHFTLELLQAALAPLLQEKIVLREGTASTSLFAVEATDVVAYNPSFSTSKSSLRLSRRSGKDLQGVGGTKSDQNVCRSDGVDAAIIKHLKAHSSQTHREVVKCCTETLPFSVSGNFVKLRLEELLRKGYISRTAATDPEECTYAYLM